ncbi:ribbon-helix-helix protein, CopG family [Halomonas alkalicola]|uniref:ribbon-helix-helix protein, CopG family n=1 Tax=Halomonas alkalicola TaxID=1930622 RepID=UPI00265DAFFF|nr:ribbon-helix-helix protein, CopG family [Halomonas alkalicola]
MATTKTATVTFRIDPALKEALRTAAAQEHRSIANMVEVLIREYCGREGISIPEQAALLGDDKSNNRT